jgi:hypothetical protein
MPKMVTVKVNKDFKPSTPEEVAALAVAKKLPSRELPYVTAMENVKQSGGLYVIASQEPGPAQAPGPRALEDMSNDELKVMMLTTGIRPQKQMTRAEVIKSIRIKLAEVEIADEG